MDFSATVSHCVTGFGNCESMKVSDIECTTRAGHRSIVLLCGGDQSTQTKDIQSAVEYWEDWQERTRHEDSTRDPPSRRVVARVIEGCSVCCVIVARGCRRRTRRLFRWSAPFGGSTQHCTGEPLLCAQSWRQPSLGGAGDHNESGRHEAFSWREECAQ